jgi:hypothetical protein
MPAPGRREATSVLVFSGKSAWFFTRERKFDQLDALPEPRAA